MFNDFYYWLFMAFLLGDLIGFIECGIVEVIKFRKRVREGIIIIDREKYENSKKR